MTTLQPGRPTGTEPGPAFATNPSGIYDVVVALFCGLLLISNVAATKTITVVDHLPAFLGGGISPTAARSCSRSTYIIGDVLAEVYGMPQARRAIWVGFALAALASFTFLARRGRRRQPRFQEPGSLRGRARLRAADRAGQPAAGTWPASS